jgi:ferredoxin
MPEQVPIDVLYSFWLPFAARTAAGITLALFGVMGLVAVTVPWWSKPRRENRLTISSVNERLCTGCEQCYEDCPYEAIEMGERSDGRTGIVARVDPSLCVGCGICAGSCAPMGVGPAGRTGRDQLAAIRAFMETEPVGAKAVLVVACERSAVQGAGFQGNPVFAITCAGNLHTSVVEYALRAGAGGVLIVACPPRDCWNREGPKWLEQRLYHEREAELQERVDRSRVRLMYSGAHGSALVAAELRDFQEQLASAIIEAESSIDILAMCERAETESGA